MMTRGQVELELIRRVGGFVEAANMNTTQVDGTNPDLNGPIGYALRAVGVTVINVVNVTDAEVAMVVDDQDKFLDIAEYRLLLAVQGNLLAVDWRTGQREEKLGQLGTQLSFMIKAKKDALDDLYGTIGVDEGVSAGRYNLNFQETVRTS